MDVDEGNGVFLINTDDTDQSDNCTLYYSPRFAFWDVPVISKIKESIFYHNIKRACGDAADSGYPNDKWSVQKFLTNRENGMGHIRNGDYNAEIYRKINNIYGPREICKRITKLEQKIHISKFNKSGNLLTIASRETVQIYDSSNDKYNMIEGFVARGHQRILDIDYSPCGNYLVYSTWTGHVISYGLPSGADSHRLFNIQCNLVRLYAYSVKISPCGEYFVVGLNGSTLFMFDIRNGRTYHKVQPETIRGYGVKYTAVSFLGPDPNIFVTGDQWGKLNLWDKRIPQAPVVQMWGHRSRITYIDSAHNDRFFLTNSKDQSIKIWDSRFISEHSHLHSRPRDDLALITFRGHVVTKTLIRAKFSPLETTGQRYVYTGCSRGYARIYDILTGLVKREIDCCEDEVIRDLDWHPKRQEMIISSDSGTLALYGVKQETKSSQIERT